MSTSGALRRAFFHAIFAVALAGFAAYSLKAQVSVAVSPPVGMIEASGNLNFTASVQGTLPGENSGLTWSLNDQPISNANRITYDFSTAPVGVPLTLKATSAFDNSKFAAIPLLSLRGSDLGQIRLPDAIAYHPATGFVYVATLVANGAKVDTQILQISPDGSPASVFTYPSAVITKLIPYSAGETSYLLAVDFANNLISALNLSSKTQKRVVGGLVSPVSAAFHPITGDLYIAEQNARRISIVSRTPLDSAISGTGDAPIGPLPITIPNISGVSFLVDSGSAKTFLLASTSDGNLFQVNLSDNSSVAVASGLGIAEQVLVLQSSQLGFSFVLTGNSTRIDGQGRITAMLSQGSGQPFGAPYSLTTGLDTVTDLAFVPPGTRYSPNGRWLILAASSSTSAGRGKIVRWEPDPGAQADFFVFGDSIQPSLSLLSPSAGIPLLPGAPVELRWSYIDGNPLNRASAPVATPAQILVSTDGGNTFLPAGPSFLPSGPQGNQYSQIWQVPANLAGQTIRIAIQMSGFNGNPLKATSGDLTVSDPLFGLPEALFLAPNFVVAGNSATLNIDGLNLQHATGVSVGDDVTVSGVKQVSSSRLQVEIQPASSASPGPRSAFACNPTACQSTPNAFFVLSPNDPQITSIAPQSGAPGGTVVITGSNFSGFAANNVVTFGNFVAAVSQALPTKLTVQTPFGLNRGDVAVSVQTNGVPSNTARFVLVPSGFVAPMLNTDGIVNGASFSVGTSPVAAGSILSLFGANMVPSIAGAIDLPLPTQILNTTVMIGGIAAPIFFAAPNQLNVQMPEEVAGLSSVAVALNYLNVIGNTVLLSVAPQAPGIFSLATTGKGPGAVLNQNGSLNGLTNPEHIGNTLQVYATGLGTTTPPVPTGNAASSSPLSNSVNPPSATIDGVPARVTFAGRSPGFVGLDQVNVVAPAGAATGRPVELVIMAGSNASNAVTVVLVP